MVRVRVPVAVTAGDVVGLAIGVDLGLFARILEFDCSGTAIERLNPR